MSLADGNTSRILNAKIETVPFPSGQCPKTIEDIRAWIGTFGIDFKVSALFGYTAGRLTDAPVESRSLPRFVFDDARRFLGVQTWVPEMGAWTMGGTIGELRTIVRQADTVADDMLEKGLAGWYLADGSRSGVPDLTGDVTLADQDLVDPGNLVDNTVKSKAVAPSQYFKGTSPNWDVYTVCYIGTL